MAVQNTPVADWRKEALVVVVSLQRTLDDRGRARILKQFGAVMLARTQYAFATESLFAKWPARYPKQKPPKFNVAGAIQDLLEGNKVKSRRWDDRPALKDRGILARSFSSATKALTYPNAYTVEIGSTLPYAAVHQWGGESEPKPLTRDFKVKLAAFLTTKKGRTVRDKMVHLLELDSYSQEILARPFLGVLDEDLHKFRDIIEEAGREAQERALHKLRNPTPRTKPGTLPKLSRWFKNWWKGK